MRPLYALAASLGLVFLAAPVSANDGVSVPGTADGTPSCWGLACDLINQVCRKAGGYNCVGMAAEDGALVEAQCMGEVCDAINKLCYKAFKVHCVG